jgi:hypothetical protein
MHSVQITSHRYSVIKPLLLVVAALLLMAGLSSVARAANIGSGTRGAGLPRGIVDPSAEGNDEPPFAAGPRGFSLSVTGKTRDGATVTPTLAKPLHIGLLVEDITALPWHAVGMVRLGEQRAGTYPLHWNLKVDGKPLPAGNYLVFEEVLSSQNLPTGVPPCQDEALLTLSSSGHNHVRMLTINYPSLPTDNPAPAF